MSRDPLLTCWSQLELPEQLALTLLAQWDEPHRHYHGRSHLSHGLQVLDRLAAPRLVVLAWWFHDAVHHCDTPHDEQASAEQARTALSSLLPAAQVAEVVRLILLTIDHRPDADDHPGALICDADLHSLTLPHQNYLDQVIQLRAERPDVGEAHWQAGRIARLQQLLARPQLFHTPIGHAEWEPLARANLTTERDALIGADMEGQR